MTEVTKLVLLRLKIVHDDLTDPNVICHHVEVAYDDIDGSVISSETLEVYDDEFGSNVARNTHDAVNNQTR